ncbi:MAG: hypothetical protein KF745_13535 [Phycisphaeraceae bacterium]|nr:hypothetical protein [Phycisphaeraceae bacterium]
MAYDPSFAIGRLAAILAAALSLSPALAGPRPDCPGDFTRDGSVDPVDVSTFIRAWVALDPAADFNSDGLVTAPDVSSFISAWLGSLATTGGHCPLANPPAPIVFVSRRIPACGSDAWSTPRALPGVGPATRFIPAAPGSLMILEPSGQLRTLINGANPTSASFNLIDVNAPAVSYDAQWIAFAGLPAPPPGTTYPSLPNSNPGAWRLFLIRPNGADLRQLTFSSQDSLDLSQFGSAAAALRPYDDTDPVFLPDGRICFSSTRFPSFSHYAATRTTNLYVINTNGTRLIRLTADRNAADRPLVDPISGRIVYSRWIRNPRFPAASADTTIPVDPDDPGQGFLESNGLTTDPAAAVGGPSMNRNFWQLISLNTDGSAIRLWSGRGRDQHLNHAYPGSFAPDGTLFAAYYPDLSLTHTAGFGGIRHWSPGPHPWLPVLGVTDTSAPPLNPIAPHIRAAPLYATDPEFIPAPGGSGGGGGVVLSAAPDLHQDYGLYLCAPDGSNLRLLLDLPNTSELRPRVIRSRPLAPLIRDQYRDFPTEPAPPLLPPANPESFLAPGHTFIFYSFNIYANADVDTDIISAPAVGSADFIRFFADPQRTSPGFASLDWPIHLGDTPIRPDGLPALPGGGASLSFPPAPGSLPLFEQLRSNSGIVPLTGGPTPEGAAHGGAANFAPPGTSTVCVGCHTGHSMIPVPADGSEAVWTNLAPGAAVTTSSSRTPTAHLGLIDRRALKADPQSTWTSAPNQPDNQWARLTFPVPIAVRRIVLYDVNPSAASTLHTASARIRLYEDAAATLLRADTTASNLSPSGTPIPFPDLSRIRAVRIDLLSVSGSFLSAPAAGLAEIEVIAKGEAP